MASATDGSVTEHDEEHAHEHPSDWVYVKIALLLGALTALEVFTYFDSVHNMGRNTLFLVLIVLMVIKFVLVAGYFMHLKFDSPLFTNLFTAGLILAMAVYLVALTAFRIWD